MKKRFSKIAIAALMTLAVSAAPAHANKAEAELTLDNSFTQNGKQVFEGSIDSPKKACDKDRKIEIFIDNKGEDEMIAKGKASLKSKLPGVWIYDVKRSGMPLADYFYAKAEATDECKKAQSPTVLFTR